MEFPRHLHKPDGLYVVCPDADTCDALQARGWALLPTGYVEQPKAVTLTDALAADVIEQEPEPPKKKGKKAE